MKLGPWYTTFAKRASRFCGRPGTFVLALLVIVAWQLVINTGTTIITFLMVFLIQNTQNRDTEAMQVKLDD